MRKKNANSEICLVYKKGKVRNPTREIVCERCGIKFIVKTCGKTKYCVECKCILQERRKIDCKKKREERQ